MRELVQSLAALHPGDRLELYGHRWRRPRGAAPPALPANARLHRRRVPAPALALAAHAGLGAGRLLGGVDVVHWTDYAPLAGRRAPVVATLHDICFETLPACYGPAQRRRLRRVTHLALQRAARVIVPSDRVREDLRRHHGVEDERVRVVPHGLRALPAAAPARDLGRYVLFVGTLQPRKNVLRLVQAFDAVQARHADLRLLLAGPPGWQAAPVLEALAARAHVLHEPAPTAARLAALYGGALAVALPSLGEGFGLPVLEAMAYGRPLLVGRETACSDLARDAALAVDAYDVDALSAALERLVVEGDVRERLGGAGRRRAADFTWEAAARATRAVYAEACDS